MGPKRNRLLIVPLGVVAGHVLGYLVAHPEPLARAEVLGSAHDYLGPAWILSWSAAAAAIGAVAWDAVRNRAVPLPSPAVLFRLQASLFLALEVMERAPLPNPVAAALEEPAVWIGFALQLLLAVVAHRLLSSAAETVRAWFARRRPAPRSPQLHAAGAGPSERTSPTARHPGRAPPLLLAS